MVWRAKRFPSLAVCQSNMRPRFPRVLLFVSSLPLRAEPANSLITASDLLKINPLADPSICPDGQQAAYTVRSLETQPSADIAYRNLLWLASLDGSNMPRVFMQESANTLNPA